MTLDTSVLGDSNLTTLEAQKEAKETPKRLPRRQLIEAGKIVLTKKLSFGTSIKIRTGVILGKFQKINYPYSKEHLPEDEEEFFQETINIDTLPVDCFIEVWSKLPGSEEYEVTEYKKLK